MSESFYKGKRVFLTGHTGFKGAWLSRILIEQGAYVTGYALPPKGEPNLFGLSGVEKEMVSVLGDIRDGETLKKAMEQAQPQLVFHLAAQPLVLEGYENPRETYSVNVMGTVELLEAVRKTPQVHSVVNVTTDKVYRNLELPQGYTEQDELDGYDPYANSKSCSEEITGCYRRCFLKEQGVAVSTARAGNVIGGGDFSPNRIVPDCVRAAIGGEKIRLRHPGGVRPYQHVLEPLFAYLLLAQAQYQDPFLQGCYNIGPRLRDCVSNRELAQRFCALWGNGLALEEGEQSLGPKETGRLSLQIQKAQRVLGWTPVWTVEEALEHTIRWTKCWLEKGDIWNCMGEQIRCFSKAAKRLYRPLSPGDTP